MTSPITTNLARRRHAWIEFEYTDPYPCPTCGHRLVIRPFAACLAEGLKACSLSERTAKPDEVEDLCVELEPDAAARADDIRAG